MTPKRRWYLYSFLGSIKMTQVRLRDIKNQPEFAGETHDIARELDKMFNELTGQIEADIRYATWLAKQKAAEEKPENQK